MLNQCALAASPSEASPSPAVLPTSDFNHFGLRFDASVAIVVPKLSGSRKLTYQVCHEVEGATSCAEKDSIGLFGPPGQPSAHLHVSKQDYQIKQKVFTPSWNLTKPSDVISAWSRVELTDGSDLVPMDTPPFLIYNFLEDMPSVAHLQEGVRREQYGDMLDDFHVKSFCDSYEYIFVDENNKPSLKRWELGLRIKC